MTLVFALQWLSLHSESDQVVVSVYTDFLPNSKETVLIDSIADDDKLILQNVDQ